MAKCGTGTLGFLDCHPNIAFRGTEPRFFLNRKNNLAIIDAWRRGDNVELQRQRFKYTNSLPRASRDEYLIEKSPQYAGGRYSALVSRALAMKILNPNLKIIVYNCDPIKQMYSQYSMQERRKSFKGNECKGPCLQGSMENAMKDWAGRIWTRRKNPLCQGKRVCYGLRKNLAAWRRVFTDSHVFIVDGERMAHNADSEMTLLLDFLQVPAQTFSFSNQPNKGFSCIQQPLPFCLNPAKGTSRKSDVYEIFPE